MSDRTTEAPRPGTLVEGHRLDQATFHALYEAMPPGTRAELIDGVVSRLCNRQGRSWRIGVMETT